MTKSAQSNIRDCRNATRFGLILVIVIMAHHAHAQTVGPEPVPLPATTTAAPMAAPLATQSPLGNSKQPLEITADRSLEWKRNDKLFIAHDNALARQGDMSVAANTLTAHYTEGGKTADGKAGSGMQITQVEADGTVIIKSRESAAYGQHANYDLEAGKSIMTGDNLKLVTTDQTVTARDRFEYWVGEGKLLAVGNADVVRGQDRLQADQVSAVMKDDATGKRVIDTLDAKGNVIITTPTEIVTGAYAIYRAGTNKAEMTGGVTIKRGPNILQGDRAEVDLNTNVSQIFGNQAAGGKAGQVRAVFYPGSDKKLDPKVGLQ